MPGAGIFPMSDAYTVNTHETQERVFENWWRTHQAIPGKSTVRQSAHVTSAITSTCRVIISTSRVTVSASNVTTQQLLSLKSHSTKTICNLGTVDKNSRSRHKTCATETKHVKEQSMRNLFSASRKQDLKKS